MFGVWTRSLVFSKSNGNDFKRDLWWVLGWSMRGLCLENELPLPSNFLCALPFYPLHAHKTNGSSVAKEQAQQVEAVWNMWTCSKWNALHMEWNFGFNFTFEPILKIAIAVCASWSSRVCCLWLDDWCEVIWFSSINNGAQNGMNPVTEGLAYVVFSGAGFLSFLFDIFLAFAFADTAI